MMRSSVATKSARKLDGLSSYFRAMGKYPPLTREEEHVLAVRAGRGDRLAKQQLARHNLALVISIVRKQRRGRVPLDDIVQEGSVGLMRAIEKFDPHAGTRFSTYAVWWIRAHVGRCLKEARSTVRPRSGEVALSDVSLDAPIRQDGDATHLDLLEADAAGPESSYLSAESDRAVRDALAKVRKRVGELGWEIVRDRLQQDSATTLAEIGERWSISRERVRQVEVRTKQLLSRHLEPVALEAA
jgi:RNA polymerase sigma factor (sigma-70 family)